MSIEGGDGDDDNGSMNDADAFVKEVQGPEDNLYIIFFKKDDNEMSKDVHTELDKAPEDDRLKDYDIFQEDWKGKWSIKVGELDVRDQTKWKAASDLIGANDADFKMTFPLAMITRKGKGYLASLKEFLSTKGEDGAEEKYLS
jgi:acyl-CoA-binding protein